MPDNLDVTPGSGAKVAADEAQYSGDTTKVQYVGLGIVTGAEGSRTMTPAPGDTTEGIKFQVTALGGPTETPPASDTASAYLNGRLQRIAQRLTSLIALLPTSLGAGGGLKVDGSGTPLPVSGTVAVTQASLGAPTDPAESDPSAVSATIPSLLRGILQRVLSLAADTTLTGGTQKSRLTDGTNDAGVGNAQPASSAYALFVRVVSAANLIITGSQAAGATATDNPVVLAGVNASGAVTRVLTDNAGAIEVNQIDQQQRGALTDRSGTITSGGNAQQIAAANTARRYLLVQNVSDTDMWVNVGVTAVANQPSIRLLANGGAFVMEGFFCATGLVSIIGATTGKAFTAKEYP